VIPYLLPASGAVGPHAVAPHPQVMLRPDEVGHVPEVVEQMLQRLEDLGAAQQVGNAWSAATPWRRPSTQRAHVTRAQGGGCRLHAHFWLGTGARYCPASGC
jgi:hypothetical protein